MIKSVKLLKHDEIKEGTMKDGLPVPPRPEIIYFVIETDELVNGGVTTVPNDPTNRHYQEIKEWYGKKKIKPFRFKFE